MRGLFERIKRLWTKRRRGQPEQAAKDQGPAPPRKAPAPVSIEIYGVDPLRFGSCWASNDCDGCQPAPSEVQVQALFGAFLSLTGDEARAARLVAAVQAGRICRFRVKRIVCRCRAVIVDAINRHDKTAEKLGGPIGVRLACVYARGELARLAARCDREAAAESLRQNGGRIGSTGGAQSGAAPSAP